MADNREHTEALDENARYLAIDAIYRIPADFDDDAWEKVFQGICALFGCDGGEENCPNESFGTCSGSLQTCYDWHNWQENETQRLQAEVDRLHRQITQLAQELDDEAERNIELAGPAAVNADWFRADKLIYSAEQLTTDAARVRALLQPAPQPVPDNQPEDK